MRKYGGSRHPPLPRPVKSNLFKVQKCLKHVRTVDFAGKLQYDVHGITDNAFVDGMPEDEIRERLGAIGYEI